MALTPYAQAAITPPQAERRSYFRYEISLPIQFTSLGISPRTPNVSGRTLNVSSRGVLFETDEKKLSVGRPMKILIDWPVRLDGEHRLELAMWGNVVRRNGRLVAVWVLRHEFQTAAA